MFCPGLVFKAGVWGWSQLCHRKSHFPWFAVTIVVHPSQLTAQSKMPQYQGRCSADAVINGLVIWYEL